MKIIFSKDTKIDDVWFYLDDIFTSLKANL